MRRVATASLLLLLVSVIAACVNETEMRKRDIQTFLQTGTGEYSNEAGERLIMVPVYARMIGLDTMYLERTTRNGTTGRLLVLERSPDGEKVVQFSYVFTQPSSVAQPDPAARAAVLAAAERRASGRNLRHHTVRGPELADVHLRRRPADELPACAAGHYRISARHFRGVCESPASRAPCRTSRCCSPA